MDDQIMSLKLVVRKIKSIGVFGMKKLLMLILLTSIFVLVFVLVRCGNDDNFSVEDLIGTWVMIYDDEAAVSITGGNFVMILNEDGTGLDGDTGRPYGVSQITWEIRNGNHLYLTDESITLRLKVASYADGVLHLTYLDFPELIGSTYIRVDNIELTDEMIQR